MSKDTKPFPIAEQFGTPNGHRYFRSSDDGRWAVADNSGEYPWLTDDGVLWVVPDQEIEVGGDHCILRLTQHEEPARTGCSPAEAVLVAGKLGLRIKTAAGVFRVESDEPPAPASAVYVVTWSYETSAQDCTPQEAADLAASVFRSGGDPSAPPGFNELSVARWDGEHEESLGEFHVQIN